MAALLLWCLLGLGAWWGFGWPTLALALPATLLATLMAGLLLRARRQQAALHAMLRQEQERRAAAEQALQRDHRMASVGRLTRGLAHDFNNHLTAVNSNIELLARRLPPDAAKLTRLAEAAIDGVRRAALLTHHLLSLSRKQPVEPEPVDLGRLVSGMTELLARALGKSVTLETSLADGLWLAWADATQVEWCLLEMALNARDAMPHGGTMTIETANLGPDEVPPLACVTGGEPGWVVLAVCDTREAAVETATQWTGEAVAGGEVRLCSRPGGGAEARLYLPRHLVQPAVRAPCTAGANAAASATILLVEDDQDIRSATAATLREMGYRVLEAADAMEGFRLIVDGGGIDLLFTDIGLPAGVDGRALADAARNLVPDLRILFTTGGVQAEGGGPAPAERGVLLLPKPFSEHQLAMKIREALPDRAATPELAAGAA